MLGRARHPRSLPPLRLWPEVGLRCPFRPLLWPPEPLHLPVIPQSNAVRANVDRCGIELSEKDLVELRSRYGIPPSVIIRRPKATKRANALPPGLRTIFVVALENGLRLPVHSYLGDVLSMAGIYAAQITPNMWIYIIGFYSACLLAGVTPTVEFFLTSFSQRTQKDDFLYFVVKLEMKGFREAFLSKVGLETWRPYFFFASGEGLPLGVPSGFTSHPNSKRALPRSTKHKADPIALSTYWANRRPMPLHFYSGHQVLTAVGLFPGSNVYLGTLKALRATYNVHDQVPAPPPSAPLDSSVQLPLRPIAPIVADPMIVSSSSEEN
ncbi:hypothetical protein LIER_14480 [Lithospermum erythrorhizon]|uniref:Transposase (putative) gypsy type domain-containing protein n=1 Tax=Lithospermum erythrorhizon TaxID=34254 RepID=A0AAV3Q0X8_LITER